MDLVCYLRVSSKAQGASGLGLAAQEHAAQEFARQHGGRIIATYREVESGARCDRPELAKAIGHARLSRATLLVAKLCRLSRNAAFLLALLDSGLECRCVDAPFVTKFSLQILACVAEMEREAISSRTAAALQALKRKGAKLGSAREGHWEGRHHLRVNGLAKGRPVAARVHRKAADEAYTHLYATIKEMRAEGLSLREIASKLTELGHTTRRGRPWNAMQVRAVLLRAARLVHGSGEFWCAGK
jgi:DNA invertase Pin-like site-specific DNA recombinase